MHSDSAGPTESTRLNVPSSDVNAITPLLSLDKSGLFPYHHASLIWGFKEAVWCHSRISRARVRQGRGSVRICRILTTDQNMFHRHCGTVVVSLCNAGQIAGPRLYSSFRLLVSTWNLQSIACHCVGRLICRSRAAFLHDNVLQPGDSNDSSICNLLGAQMVSPWQATKYPRAHSVKVTAKESLLPGSKTMQRSVYA